MVKDRLILQLSLRLKIRGFEQDKSWSRKLFEHKANVVRHKATSDSN